MTRTNRRKPYYTLREILARWGMDADDVAAYVLEGELCLSLPVAALMMEVSDMHRAADGRIRVEPKARQAQVGPIDLASIDAYAVLSHGTAPVARFLSATRDLLEPIDDAGERYTLPVKRSQLVVRHQELERFEMEHDLGHAEETVASLPARQRAWHAPGMRGAPPRYDWEGCMCELGAIAHDEGLPETQAELVRRVLDWFSASAGPEGVPSESAVKQRVSRFWHRLRGTPSRAAA